MEEVQLESLAADHAVGLWKNVIIGMWRKTPRVKGVKECSELAERAHKKFPKGTVVFLIIAERPTPPPSSDARQIFAKMMTSYNGVTRCTAVVAEGGSLSVSVVRGVLTSLLILARHDTPTKMFGKVGEAATWLRQELANAQAPVFDTVELDAAVNSLRARMDAEERASV